MDNFNTYLLYIIVILLLVLLLSYIKYLIAKKNYSKQLFIADSWKYKAYLWKKFYYLDNTSEKIKSSKVQVITLNAQYFSLGYEERFILPSLKASQIEPEFYDWDPLSDSIINEYTFNKKEDVQ